ncbi:MAG: ABC transporter ATP-binding protein [Candidatus Lokiarchaeota archaeon]|nr:ABC transporter ATP-binding protein [Candidatus Lokiarchaeota archaeon]
MDIINCINISKQFGFFLALKKISFKIEENTTFGILGPNGAGKTTMIKILSGLMNPTHGDIIINGLNYKDHPRSIKQDIGVITDKSFLYEDLTMYENLKFYDNLYYNFKKSQTKVKIDRYTELFNLDDWVFEPIRNLSKGMKQKVELIRALMHSPAILILDEPFSSIDQKTIPLLINLLVELQKKDNITIIISTHNIEIAQQICDKILIIKKGKMVKTIAKKDIQTEKIKEYM